MLPKPGLAISKERAASLRTHAITGSAEPAWVRVRARLSARVRARVRGLGSVVRVRVRVRARMRVRVRVRAHREAEVAQQVGLLVRAGADGHEEGLHLVLPPGEEI